MPIEMSGMHVIQIGVPSPRRPARKPKIQPLTVHMIERLPSFLLEPSSKVIFGACTRVQHCGGCLHCHCLERGLAPSATIVTTIRFALLMISESHHSKEAALNSLLKIE